MGAVLANAIHDACGARLLDLPMTPDRIKAALKASPGMADAVRRANSAAG
jgi:hypothetical protein